jgi:hypothetical protein
MIFVIDTTNIRIRPLYGLVRRKKLEKSNNQPICDVTLRA